MNMPTWIKKFVILLSEMTLDIYVVQYVIIDRIKGLGFFFPLNWLVLTARILFSAYILHKACALIYSGVDKAMSKKQKVVGRYKV